MTKMPLSPEPFPPRRTYRNFCGDLVLEPQPLNRLKNRSSGLFWRKNPLLFWILIPPENLIVWHRSSCSAQIAPCCRSWLSSPRARGSLVCSVFFLSYHGIPWVRQINVQVTIFPENLFPGLALQQPFWISKLLIYLSMWAPLKRLFTTSRYCDVSQDGNA